MRKLLLFALIAMAAARLYGENERSEVFAPFVSRLKAEAGENSITLTWRNSPDVEGPLFIYRHSEEISESNFNQSELIARLPPGTDSYVDIPPNLQSYYYAVLLEDERGKRYKLFIPFRNITARGRAIRSLPPEEDLAARITGIEAITEEDSILISFKVSRVNRVLLLFRSTEPIRSSEDLLEASTPLTLDPITTSYRDYPIPGVEYFYAVIDAGLFKIGKAKLIPGENSTREAVSLPIGLERIGLPDTTGLKPLPLPYLLLSSGVEKASELAPSSPILLPERVELQPATAKAAGELLEVVSSPEAPEREIQILTVDRAERTVGEDYTLQTIIKEHLTGKDFSGAEESLIKFLSIPRPPEIQARARFYLAQVYYFTGRYRKAFLEFLLSRDLYYQQVQVWLEACYGKLWFRKD